MTTEEYLIKRITELEAENERLKNLIESREVRFRFETRDMPKHTYKVEFENGIIKLSKENKDE